jgi:hypothetical protein
VAEKDCHLKKMIKALNRKSIERRRFILPFGPGDHEKREKKQSHGKNNIRCSE